MNLVELLLAGAAIELEMRARRTPYCLRNRPHDAISLTVLCACWKVGDVGRGWA